MSFKFCRRISILDKEWENTKFDNLNVRFGLNSLSYDMLMGIKEKDQPLLFK